MSAPNTDASLNKTTRIKERTSVQFRAEVFNLSNKFNFYQAQPNSTLTSSAFGSVDEGECKQQQRRSAKSHSAFGKVELLRSAESKIDRGFRLSELSSPDRLTTFGCR
jgi:hypothetical protein